MCNKVIIRERNQVLKSGFFFVCTLFQLVCGLILTEAFDGESEGLRILSWMNIYFYILRLKVCYILYFIMVKYKNN